MTSRLIKTVAAVLSATLISGAAITLASDIVPMPPERKEFASPAGDFVFVLFTTDHWRSRKSVGELFQVTQQGRALLWTRHLPHEYRPRYVLLNDNAAVLLIDEWVNIKSRYAVMLLDRDNHVVAQHDLDAVLKVLGVPIATVTQLARHGWWIVSPPVLDAAGEHATVETAGKTLTIRLRDGHLTIYK